MSRVHVVCSNIIERSGKFCFVKETKRIAEGRYSLPAGKLEFGETLIQCAKREAEEETGLVVEPLAIVGIYQRPISREDTNTTTFVFLSTVVSEGTKRSETHPGVVFLTPHEVRVYDREHRLRSRYMLRAVEDYLVGVALDLSLLTILA